MFALTLTPVCRSRRHSEQQQRCLLERHLNFWHFPSIESSNRYCVIGAGPAGLIAARALKHAGIPYEQYERNPDVGGIWDINNDWSPMYESAHFISSKTVSNIPGLDMPEDYPDYPRHEQIFEYMKSFAAAYDLYPQITFNTHVERAEPDGDGWRVTLSSGETKRFAGLFLCSGNTWDPNLPDYPGTFAGESFHSVKYLRPDVFRGKRVLVVGGGNSGCDIACDAAVHADKAFLSLRRGYHFIPKYVFGMPADKFSSGINLPRFVERRVLSAVLRLLVGDLTKFGLPKPDHEVLETHPIMNTQVLHYMGHGDLEYRPDIERLDGKLVWFKDGRSEEVDLIVFATGYKVTYPYMDRSLFEWKMKYPDLFLSAHHREFDNVCCLGLHQTDGGAYDFFSLQADMMCNFILDQRDNPERAERFRQLKRTDPDLRGGVNYVDSARHATYVKKAAYKRYCNKVMRQLQWQRFGESQPPGVGDPDRQTAGNAPGKVAYT